MSQSLPLHPVVLDILRPCFTFHGDQDSILTNFDFCHSLINNGYEDHQDFESHLRFGLVNSTKIAGLRYPFWLR